MIISALHTSGCVSITLRALRHIVRSCSFHLHGRLASQRATKDCGAPTVHSNTYSIKETGIVHRGKKGGYTKNPGWATRKQPELPPGPTTTAPPTRDTVLVMSPDRAKLTLDTPRNAGVVRFCRTVPRGTRDDDAEENPVSPPTRTKLVGSKGSDSSGAGSPPGQLRCRTCNAATRASRVCTATWLRKLSNGSTPTAPVHASRVACGRPILAVSAHRGSSQGTGISSSTQAAAMWPFQGWTREITKTGDDGRGQCVQNPEGTSGTNNSVSTPQTCSNAPPRPLP